MRRLKLVPAETAARKHKLRPEAGSGIFRFATVPGVLELFPMMPVMGNLTLVVAVLSYAGKLDLTAVADRDGCPDLEVFAQGVRRALDDLARSVLAPAF